MGTDVVCVCKRTGIRGQLGCVFSGLGVWVKIVELKIKFVERHMHFVSKHTMRLHSGSRCICRNTSWPERVCVALPVTFLSPRVQLEFTVSPTSLNVCCGKESETGVCVCVCVCLCVFTSLPGVSPKATYMLTKLWLWGERQLVCVCVCVCAHMCIYFSLKCACVHACMRDRCPLSDDLEFCDVVAPERLFYSPPWHYSFSSVSCYYTVEGCVLFDKPHYLPFCTTTTTTTASSLRPLSSCSCVVSPAGRCEREVITLCGWEM